MNTMNPKVLPAPQRTSSSVSQVLRAMDEEGHNLRSPGALHQSPYTIRVANSASSRERAYRLACRVYRQSGFMPHGEERCVSAYDMLPQTITLLAEDDHGEAVATVTLVFDSPFRLPCDEIYAVELDAPRREGKRLAEVTRLAIAPEHTGCRILLVQLFNYAYIFAAKVHGATDFVIEVNPRHAAYYQRLLKFEIIGPERSCPRVSGAPAVLLGLPLALVNWECERVSTDGRTGRTLYAWFLTAPEEARVREYLDAQHRPMLAHESRVLYRSA